PPPADSDQHGRQRLLAGQRVRRAALALGEIRRGLSPRLRHCLRRARRLDPLLPVLQSSASAPCAGASNPGPGLLHRTARTTHCFTSRPSTYRRRITCLDSPGHLYVYRTSASNPGSFARYADLWPSRFVRLTRLENRQGESSTVTITIAAFA